MTVVITGWHSRIADEFRNLIDDDPALGAHCGDPGFPLYAERYLFCQGLLRARAAEEQTDVEIAESVRVNYSSVQRTCNSILEVNDGARICIVGSESAYRGSFDGVYAASKALLHEYVEKTVLSSPDQQLVAISPGIISDAGMTLRRTDTTTLERRRREHPKQRFLTAKEVATMAYVLLYVDAGYTSGTVVRMHGGQK